MDLIGYNKRVQKDKVTGFEKFAYGWRLFQVLCKHKKLI